MSPIDRSTISPQHSPTSSDFDFLSLPSPGPQNNAPLPPLDPHEAPSPNDNTLEPTLSPFADLLNTEPLNPTRSIFDIASVVESANQEFDTTCRTPPPFFSISCENPSFDEVPLQTTESFFQASENFSTCLSFLSHFARYVFEKQKCLESHQIDFSFAELISIYTSWPWETTYEKLLEQIHELLKKTPETKPVFLEQDILKTFIEETFPFLLKEEVKELSSLPLFSTPFSLSKKLLRWLQLYNLDLFHHLEGHTQLTYAYVSNLFPEHLYALREEFAAYNLQSFDSQEWVTRTFDSAIRLSANNLSCFERETLAGLSPYAFSFLNNLIKEVCEEQDPIKQRARIRYILQFIRLITICNSQHPHRVGISDLNAILGAFTHLLRISNLLTPDFLPLTIDIITHLTSLKLQHPMGTLLFLTTPLVWTSTLTTILSKVNNYIQHPPIPEIAIWCTEFDILRASLCWLQYLSNEGQPIIPLRKEIVTLFNLLALLDIKTTYLEMLFPCAHQLAHHSVSPEEHCLLYSSYIYLAHNTLNNTPDDSSKEHANHGRYFLYYACQQLGRMSERDRENTLKKDMPDVGAFLPSLLDIFPQWKLDAYFPLGLASILEHILQVRKDTLSQESKASLKTKIATLRERYPFKV